jgi:hypothetical protein
MLHTVKPTSTKDRTKYSELQEKRRAGVFDDTREMLNRLNCEASRPELISERQMIESDENQPLTRIRDDEQDFMKNEQK